MIQWFWKRKKWTIPVTLVVLVGGSLIVLKTKKGTDEEVISATVSKQDLAYTVLATGQVTSSIDLSLSFKGSGIVRKVDAVVGKKVAAGDVLAGLDSSDLAASVTTARASLASAQANYQKLLDGASSEEVQSSQRAVDSAAVALENAKQSLEATKAQQTVAVNNAYVALLNSTFQANAGSGNLGSGTVSVSGSYNSLEQGQYKISLYNSGNGLRFIASGLENAEGDARTTPVPLGKRGLFIRFSDTNFSAGADTWTIPIPNTQAGTYVSNLNAYQTALENQRTAVSNAEAAVRTAETALSQAQANLLVKKQQARPADLQAAQAQILSAQGQLQAAFANLENTQIIAPTAGTITKVDLKVGETVPGGKEVIVIQDVDNLYVEANISEANIASVTQNQAVTYTFDALGPDKKFAGVVEAIDPASTVVSGVVNYKVTASVPKVPEVKPGMTANMSILVSEKKQVIVVPSRAVLNKDGKKVVRIVDNQKKALYHEVPVTVGLEGDGGLVEITSGLTEGQEIVTLVKKK